MRMGGFLHFHLPNLWVPYLCGFFVLVTSHLSQNKSNVIMCQNDISHPQASNKLKTLNYDTINIQNVFCLLMNFDEDIIFELSLLHQPIGHLDQMQGMDRKYNDYAWCKVKMTNINSDFGYGFQSNRCLRHLHCENDTCNWFIWFDLIFKMKSFGIVIWFNFQLQAYMLYVFLSI